MRMIIKTMLLSGAFVACSGEPDDLVCAYDATAFGDHVVFTAEGWPLSGGRADYGDDADCQRKAIELEECTGGLPRDDVDPAGVVLRGAFQSFTCCKSLMLCSCARIRSARMSEPMSSKLEEALFSLRDAAKEWTECERYRWLDWGELEDLKQAARDFAAAEAEELYECWYRGLPAHTEYESGREDGHDRLAQALRAGGLTMGVEDE